MGKHKKPVAFIWHMKEHGREILEKILENSSGSFQKAHEKFLATRDKRKRIPGQGFKRNKKDSELN